MVPSTGGRGKAKRLLQIFFVKVRVIRKQLHSVRIRCQDFQYPPDRDSHPADRGLPAHLAGFNGDPVEWRLKVHTTIMLRSARLPLPHRVRAEHLHVIRPLEGLRLRHCVTAHAALHLADRIVLVLAHPDQ